MFAGCMASVSRLSEREAGLDQEGSGGGGGAEGNVPILAHGNAR